MTPKKILVATDFSAAADVAVFRASRLAQRHKAELRLLHALPPNRWLDGLIASRRHWNVQIRSRGSAVLKEQAGKLAAELGIEVSTALVTGKASAAIAATAKQFQPDLVVVGARGERALQRSSQGLGQTALKLLEGIKVPLLLVRHGDIQLPGKILAALDLGPSSIAVARWASRVAGEGELWAMHVFEAPFAGRLRGYGVSRQALDVYSAQQQAQSERKLKRVLAKARVAKDVGRVVVRGDAIRLITRELRRLKIDTLVIGKHTKHKRDAAAPYGSVCRHLAYYAPVDVLVVP